MFQVTPSVGTSAMAQYANIRGPKGLGEDFRHRQERTEAREKMMQTIPGQPVTRSASSFIKRAAEHTPLTLKKSRR